MEKLRYMHRNPVMRGLVAAPEQWPWNSFRFYMFGEVGRVRVNDTDLLKMEGKRLPRDLRHHPPLQTTQGAGHPQFS